HHDPHLPRHHRRQDHPRRRAADALRGRHRRRRSRPDARHALGQPGSPGRLERQRPGRHRRRRRRQLSGVQAGNMARLIASLWLLLAMLAGGTGHAQPQFPERGTAPVVDAANIIDPAAEAALTAKLDAFEQANQRQFVVATIPSLDGYDIADYGYQLGRHWGLGDTENDDGIILLVAPNERRVRIEVGYGLEAVIPDGLAFDIIERDILPRFKAGDMTGGIVAGADAIIRHLELPPEQQ